MSMSMQNFKKGTLISILQQMMLTVFETSRETLLSRYLTANIHDEL